MDSHWKTWGQLFLVAGLTLLFFYMMAPFLVAILLGAITAIVCYPVYERLRRKLSAGFSAFVVTLGLTLGLLIPVFFVVYTSSYKLLQLVKQLHWLKGDWLERVSYLPWLRKTIGFIVYSLPVEREWVRERSLELLQGVIEKSSQTIAASLAEMPGLLVGVIVIILSLYFFLTDGHRFLKFLLSLSPIHQDKTVGLYHAFEQSCRGVIIGLFLSAAVQGLLVAFFFFVASLPDPFLFGAIGVGMGMIPIVGTAPIWMGGAGYLLFQSKPWLAVLMLIGGCIISVSDNVVRSWILHGTSRLHPFLALVSVMGALNLVGPAGIFLGPIIAAVFVSSLTLIPRDVVSR